MKLAALTSGGKDSMLALHKVVEMGHEVSRLVYMVPEREDSWMFHYPNARWTGLISRAIGIPAVGRRTAGVKEEELFDLKEALSKLKVDGVVYGAISSIYQKDRIDAVCEELNLKPIAPLWGLDPLSILRELLKRNFEVIFVGIYAYGLDERWLGRKLDERAIKELETLSRRYGISPVGEGGEYEPFVLDAPLYKFKIRISSGRKVWDEVRFSGYLLIEEACLTSK